MSASSEVLNAGGRGRASLRAHTTLFALAFATRLIFLVGQVGLSTPPHDDAILYDSIAARLAQGGPYIDAEGYRSRRAPAFPFLLAGVYFAVGHSWPAARMAQAIVSALTGNVLLELGASLFGTRVGLTAGLAFAVFPYTVFWSGILTTEPLCALLATAATLALIRAPQGMG